MKFPIIKRPTVLTLAAQVDLQIETRLKAICEAEWKAAQKTTSGKLRKKPVPVTYSAAVHDLLNLRQLLLGGTDPEAIAAALQTGEIANTFAKAKLA